MTASTNVVWLGALSEPELAVAGEVLDDDCRLSVLDPAPGPDSAAALGPADVIVTRSEPVTAAIIEASPRLRLIQKYGTRADGIDLQAAAAAGVPVATMPLRGCIAVAEHALTLMLALAKKLLESHQLTVAGAYRELGLSPQLTSQRQHAFQWMHVEPIQYLFGSTLGIVGFGEIGTEIATRANAFGMRVLYTKRQRLAGSFEQALAVTFADLDSLLAESDFVVLSLPLTSESEQLIGARQLGLMKPSAFLVNISRGGVVDEQALVAALAAGRIAGAGLDVFVYEPVPPDNPLLALPNVIATPHTAGGRGGAMQIQLSDVLLNVVRLAHGEQPLHTVQYPIRMEGT
jgi:phosphoglycerate dehydrogenase-like enzyme